VTNLSHRITLFVLSLNILLLLSSCGGGSNGSPLPPGDSNAPVIISTIPASGGSVKTQSDITIIFNESINLAVLDNVDIYPFINGRLSKSKAILLRENIPFSLDSSSKELTIHLFVDAVNTSNPLTLQNATKYQVNIQGISDKAGISMVGLCRFEFSTTGYQGGFTSGNTGPCDTPKPRIPLTKFSFITEFSSVQENVALGKATITVKRDTTIGVMTVDYSTQDSSAVSTTLNRDFTAKNNTLSFTDGEATKDITIDINNDNVCEGKEVFTINLSNPSQGSELGTLTTHSVTIEGNDGGENNNPGILSFKAASSRVNEDVTTVDIVVTRTSGCSGEISADIKTNGGGAATAPSDYTAIPQSKLVFGPGVTEQVIAVTIIDDQEQKEGNEDFSLSLLNPIGGNLDQTKLSHKVTILDNDILSLTYGIKQLQFSWIVYSVNETPSTIYKLMESKVGAGTSEIGSDVLFTTVDNKDGSLTLTKTFNISIHRYDWDNKSYYLDTCEINCIKSNGVNSINQSINAIGYFKASNTEANDWFGKTLAISGDGKTLAIAAYNEDNKTAGVVNHERGDVFIDPPNIDTTLKSFGAVYIFTRDTNGYWSEQSYIKASNPGANDWFGKSLALSFDGNTLAVGATGEASPSTFNTVYNISTDFPTPTTDTIVKNNTGAAYIFKRTVINVPVSPPTTPTTTFKANIWSQQAYIKASNHDIGDVFGESISLSRDGKLLAIGAPGEDSDATGMSKTIVANNNAATNAGAVYVYILGSNNNWGLDAYVKANNSAVVNATINSGGRFGTSVSISGDGSTFAVGAESESSNSKGVENDRAVINTDSSMPAAGAVYIFQHSSSIRTPWYQAAYVKASNPDDFDDFGREVALSNDGSTLAVSSISEDNSATGVFNDPATFPSIIPVADRTNGAGAVYIYSLTMSNTISTWAQSAYLKAANTGSDNFGTTLAFSGDGSTLAVGAILEGSGLSGVINDSANFLTVNNDDNSISSSGAVYVFNHDANRIWTQSSYIKSSNPDSGDQFGDGVAVNEDGSIIAVGARKEDSISTSVKNTNITPDIGNTAPNAGAVYLY